MGGAGMLTGCLGPAFEILCGHLSAKSLRRLSWASKVLWDDLLKQPSKLFACIGGVASEASALQKAAEQICWDLSDGRGGSSALVAKALPKIVDATDAFAFLRDAASTTASEVVIVFDVPVVCVNADGRMYCNPAGGKMSSRKEQCRFLTKKFPSVCRATKLSIVVTEPPSTANQLGSRASEALETRLGRLYRGCGASIAALIQMCPSLTTLRLDIRLEGHAGDRFWEAVCLALDARQVQHVTKLTLHAALPDDALCFRSLVHWILNVASKFNALTEFDCHPRVRAAWQERVSDPLFGRPLPPSLVL